MNRIELLYEIEEIIEGFELVDTKPPSWNRDTKEQIHQDLQKGIEKLCELRRKLRYDNYTLGDFLGLAHEKPPLCINPGDKEFRPIPVVDLEKLAEKAIDHRISYFKGYLRLVLYITEEDREYCRFKLVRINVGKNLW